MSIHPPPRTVAYASDYSPVSRLGGCARATAPLETVILERTGHMPMLERPDAFKTEVGHLLDTLGD
ncbi:hypothetical protein GCM10019016_079720 [Streptomyces prasinosporus]|uniref:Alpha/beta hydrolase n=1 Tax=Streptomyces prasinosporus TaxID=68256 RepID=A0ABP6U131_9ACTN|nr:hypothetical protein [Streptomyces iakyrus]GHC14009.1 hypothetical protein GCM10010332_49930 [Streptomyces albogriseolus]